MRLPVELKDGENIFPNSQVYRPGGMNGGNGGQCDKSNYAMPWADVFCEIRSHSTALCPGGKGHQGIDIRPPACRNQTYYAVAVEDGTISGVNPYTSSVTLTGATGTTYLYLHLDPPSILVKVNNKVKAGDKLGKVSNWMNGKRQTTIHLHFEVKQTVNFKGQAIRTHVPGYTSLVQANRQRLGLPNLNNNGILDPDPQLETKD
jgi:murein DD-endopeptidase MepM/ murein hydrolase activator NlpD